MLNKLCFGFWWYCVDDVACADPELCKQICGNPVGCSDTAYVRLVMELLPTGTVSCPAFCCIRTWLYTSLWCQSLCVFPPRAARFDDGGNDRCPHVFSDLHLQQCQHHFHYGYLEVFPIPCNRVGAYVSGQVCDHLWKSSTHVVDCSTGLEPNLALFFFF